MPNYLRLCITATGKTLAARQDDAVHFLAAEMTALSYALSHRDETLALTRKITSDKPDDPRPAYIYDDAVRSKSIDPTLGIPVDKLAWMQQQLIKDGNLPHPVDLAKVTDGDIRIEGARSCRTLGGARESLTALLDVERKSDPLDHCLGLRRRPVTLTFNGLATNERR